MCVTHLSLHRLILLPVTSSVLYLDILLSQHYGFYGIIIQPCGSYHAGFNVHHLQNERPLAVSHMDKYCNNFTPDMCFRSCPHPSRFIASNIIRNG